MWRKHADTLTLHMARDCLTFAPWKATLCCAGGKASRIGIVHNIMAYETLAPHAFSAMWVDRLLAFAVLPYSKPILKGALTCQP